MALALLTQISMPPNLVTQASTACRTRSSKRMSQASAKALPPARSTSAAEEVERAGGKALALACDIRFEDRVRQAVEACVTRFGGIDICVNNASAIALSGTEATEMKRYDLMHQINACGTF